VLSREGVVAIPKAASRDHVRDDVAAAEIALDAPTLAALDRSFPPPARPRRISMA